jgi:hypothetical protein
VSQDDYKMDFWGAVRKDFVHGVTEVFGFNAVDDASANATNPNVSTSDKIAGVIIAGLSVPGKGNAGERPIHSMYPDGMLVFEGEQPVRLGEPKPTDGAVGAHTQLRWDTKNQRVYQGREFNAQGKPVRDIDFTIPTFPNGTPRPGHSALTILAVVMAGNSLGLFMTATAAMAITLIVNLAALPTKITIPVFLFTILVDLGIIAACAYIGFTPSMAF